MSDGRVSSGIPGLDVLLRGGYPPLSTILVIGGPGAGKTILSMHFLVKGVSLGEPGIYVAMDETPDNIRHEMKSFGWDVMEMEKSNRLAIIDASLPRSGLPSKEKYVVDVPFTLDSLVSTINDVVNEIHAKRVVIDSLPGFGLQVKDEASIRMGVHRLNNLLISLGCTTILVSEFKPGEHYVSRYGVEDFISRGIIVLDMERKEDYFKRVLAITKMRETKIDLKVHPFDITEKGIVIKDQVPIIQEKQDEGSGKVR